MGMGDRAVTDPLLHVDGLRKVYRTRRREVVAVEDVGFSVHPGEIVGLLGANGAGKTTTIKCVCGLVRPSAGRIEIAGVDVRQKPRKAVANVAAVLEGNRNVYWRLTVRENLEFFGALQGLSTRSLKQPIDDLITLLGLEKKRDVPGRHLSRGMHQKLAIGCCLIKQTPLVLLDEPTLGLDIETSYELRSYLRQLGNEGRTVVLSSHDMSVIEDLCERVIVLNGGRVLIDDTVANLLALFKSRAYRFEILGALAPFQEAALREKFELVEISEGSEHSHIDVQLGEGGDIYELIDILQRGRTAIESIDRRDPNLEEIFLKMIADGAPDKTSPAALTKPGRSRA
jgi:ABC-2 type transport system ATP-binding protein